MLIFGKDFFRMLNMILCIGVGFQDSKEKSLFFNDAFLKI